MIFIITSPSEMLPFPSIYLQRKEGRGEGGKKGKKEGRKERGMGRKGAGEEGGLVPGGPGPP